MHMFNESFHVITEKNGWYIFHYFHLILHMPINFFQYFLTFLLKIIFISYIVISVCPPQLLPDPPASPSSNSLPSFSLSLEKKQNKKITKRKHFYLLTEALEGSIIISIVKWED